MRLIISTIIMISSLYTVSAAGTLDWDVVDVDTGGKPALAVSSKGIPHISYMTEAIMGFVKHAIRNNDGWDIQTVATGYFYGPLALAMDSRDRPHIVYHDHQDLTGQFSPDLGDQVHAFWNGFEWALATVVHPGHDGWDNSIVIDGTTPKTASIDPRQFGSSAGVEFWDGQSVEGVGSGAIDYEFATSIAIDQQGGAHISYRDFSTASRKTNQLKHATKEDDTWVITTVDPQEGSGAYSSIRIAPDGNPGISYYVREAQSSGIIRYAKFNGLTWDIQDVERVGNVIAGFIGARNLTSLAYGEDGNPRISYSTMFNLRYATWDGSRWKVVTVVESPSSGMALGGLSSHQIGPDSTVHIAFYEIPSGLTTSTGTVKYARGTLSNLAPEFSNLTDEEIAEGGMLRIPVQATDPDEDTVTFTATGLPEGATFEEGEIVWSPGFDQAGIYRISLTASDGSISTEGEITITVEEANAPVRFSSVSPSVAIVVGETGSLQTFEIVTSDPDNDPLSISWTANGKEIIGESGSTLTFTATDAEEDLISVTVSDGTETITQSWRIARILRGDFDENNRVDLDDFFLFAGAFSQEGTGENARFDLDGNQTIDFEDFFIFAIWFGVSAVDSG